jgi:hypothetical protein
MHLCNKQLVMTPVNMLAHMLLHVSFEIVIPQLNAENKLACDMHFVQHIEYVLLKIFLS